MTPALLPLSRTAMALPGAPRAIVTYPLDSRRDEHGCLWITPSGDPSFGVLAITDPATGGVLVGMLGSEVTVHRADNGRWVISEGEGPIRDGTTLAKACCRLAIDRGRWGNE